MILFNLIHDPLVYCWLVPARTDHCGTAAVRMYERNWPRFAKSMKRNRPAGLGMELVFVGHKTLIFVNCMWGWSKNYGLFWV